VGAGVGQSMQEELQEEQQREAGERIPHLSVGNRVHELLDTV
jgi:hypothetical protein